MRVERFDSLGSLGASSVVEGLTGTRSSWLLFAAMCVSLVLSVLSVFSFPALPLQNDSIYYDHMARYFLGEEHRVSLFYPPGYPLMLAAVEHLTGAAYGWALLLIQHGLRFAPLGVFALLARAQPHSLLPGLAALLYAVAPESYVLAHYVMSESLGLALASLCVCAFLWLWRRPQLGPAALAGIATGLLTLVRPAGALYLLLGLLPLYFMSLSPLGGRRPRGRWQRGTRWPRLRLVLALLAGWAGILLPVHVHNMMCCGTFALVNSAGRHLFNRVVAEDRCLRPGDAKLTWLNRLCGRGPQAPATYWWNYFPPLLGTGLNEAQADRLLLGVALSGVAKHPGRYLAGTVEGAAEILFWRRGAPADATPSRALEFQPAILGSVPEAMAYWRRRIPDGKVLLDVLERLRPVFAPGGGGPVAAFQLWVNGWLRGIEIVRPALLLLWVSGMVWAFGAGAAGAGLMAGACLIGALGHAAAEMAVPRYGLLFQPMTLYLVCAGPLGLRLLVNYVMKKIT